MNPDPATTVLPSYRAGVWKADPARSEIAFSVRQLAVIPVRGRFTGHDVTIETSEDLVSSSVTATIDLASINTGNRRRDDHLRSATFLDVRNHPTMSYRSTSVRMTDDRWIVHGELTLHGVTRQVPLAVEVSDFHSDPTGGQRARFTATAQISRGDFGIDRWSRGGAVGDRIPIRIEIEAVLQTPERE